VPDTVSTLAELKVDTGFSWKTAQDVTVEILSNTSAVLYIESPAGDVYHKAYFRSGSLYQTSITMPALEKKVNLRLADQIVTVTLENNRIHYIFE